MSNTPNFLGEEASVAQDLRGATQGAARRLVALTSDPALTRSLEELTGAGIDVCVVSNTEALCDELMNTSSSVALLDSAFVQGTLVSLVDALATQFPELRLMVSGHSSEQNQLATRISEGRVFRFVHKPASAQRLKLFMDAANRPLDPQRVSVTQTVPILPESMAAPAAQPRPLAPTGGRSPPTLALTIGALLALALAIGLFAYFSGGKKETPAPAAAAAPAEAVLSVVRQADQAFAASNFVGTDGNSAAELYGQALKLAPDNEAAKSGHDRSIEYALRGAEEALLASRIDEAALTADTVRKLEPGNARLNFLQSQIERERARVNQDATQRAAYEARQERINDSLGKMNERMRRGALLEPARDNALLHYRAAEDAGPADVAVRNARDELIATLLNAADSSLESGDAAAARKQIEAASSLNNGAPGIEPLRRRLVTLESSQKAAAAAAQAQEAAPAPAPAPAAATAQAAPQAPTVISAASLKRTREVNPTYPKEALKELVSGWVDLEFTVTKEGTVKDVVVTNAEPLRVFNEAAVSAMRRWRFEPVLRDGEAVDQRAKLRMRFAARDQGR